LILLPSSAGLFLGQSAAAADAMDIFFYLGIILVAVAIVVVIGLFVRKAYMKEDDIAPPTAFTLSDLRQMHEEGQITDAEFDRAKKAMIARSLAASGAADADSERD